MFLIMRRLSGMASFATTFAGLSSFAACPAQRAKVTYRLILPLMMRVSRPVVPQLLITAADALASRQLFRARAKTLRSQDGRAYKMGFRQFRHENDVQLTDHE